MICAVITNSHRVIALGKVPKEATVADFMPVKRVKVQTPSTQIAMLRALTSA